MNLPMRGVLVGFPSLVLAACASTPPASTPADADLAITNVAVVDVERGRVEPGHDVLVRDGRIVAVGPTGRAARASGVRTIDGSGRFLIPGLWDMHAHLHLSGNPLNVEMPLLVAHGVTGVRVMGAARPVFDTATTPMFDLHRQWQARIDSGTLTGPRILALASWPVNGEAGINANLPDFYRARTREEGAQLARYFKGHDFDFIKVYNNVSREGFLGLAEEARRLGIPFAGHEPSSLSAIEISNAGQRSLEHSRIFLFNCWSGADSARRRLLQLPPTAMRRRMVDGYDPAMCAEVFRTFARNRTYITPTHVTRRMDAFAHDSSFRNDPRLKYIPRLQRMNWGADANRMVASDSSPEGRRSFMDFYTRGLQLTRDAYRAGVPVMLGTDAGDSFVFPGASVHDELQELVKAGLTPAEALRAATLSGAEYLGRANEFGTVAVGRRADLVLLDASPLDDVANTKRIRAVFLAGRVLERAALDSMLASVEAVARK